MRSTASARMPWSPSSGSARSQVSLSDARPCSNTTTGPSGGPHSRYPIVWPPARTVRRSIGSATPPEATCRFGSHVDVHPHDRFRLRGADLDQVAELVDQPESAAGGVGRSGCHAADHRVVDVAL